LTQLGKGQSQFFEVSHYFNGLRLCQEGGFLGEVIQVWARQYGATLRCGLEHILTAVWDQTAPHERYIGQAKDTLKLADGVHDCWTRGIGARA
jgi:hypothetical protein